MIEAQIRNKIQPYFDMVGSLCSTKITPNMVTLLALVSGLLAGLAIALGHRFLGLGLLWFSGLCDVMDGTIARLYNKAQKTGAYIDLIADRMVEAAIILGCNMYYPEHYLVQLPQ